MKYKLLGVGLLGLAGLVVAQAQTFTMPPPAGVVVGAGVYNSSPPTITTGNPGMLQIDAHGNLLVAGTFTITPSGTQDVNLKNYNGSAVGATNAQYVQPGTGAIWTAALNATPTVANGNGVVSVPSSEALAATAHSTAVASAESCRVLKNSAGNLQSLRVSIAATTGYVMIFDAASAPADGAVTPALPAVRVVSDGTSGWYADDFSPAARFGTGITVCFSSTGPFTKTASATAAIGGLVQ